MVRDPVFLPISLDLHEREIDSNKHAPLSPLARHTLMKIGARSNIALKTYMLKFEICMVVNGRG